MVYRTKKFDAKAYWATKPLCTVCKKHKVKNGTICYECKKLNESTSTELKSEREPITKMDTKHTNEINTETETPNENFERLSGEAQNLLSGQFEVESLDGQKKIINDFDIELELSRAGRIKYGIKKSYGVTFGNVSEILLNTLDVPETEIAVDRNLVRQAAKIAQDVESQYKFTCVAHPGTFSFLENRKPAGREIAIPPTIYPPKPNSDPIQEGIFITITGIPGLERLYGEARALGLKLYSNDPASVPGSEKLLPHVVPNPKIKFQFARSGWGSVWLSQLSGTPFVCPEFDLLDDPEIYFNNKCVEKLGLGVVYRGQPLSEIIAEAEKLRPKIKKINEELLSRFGTYNGNEYAAKIIVDNLLTN